MYRVVFCRTAVLCALVATPALAQLLTFGQTEVNLAAPADSRTPVVQTVRLDVGGQNLPFSASVRHVGTTVQWLTISPQSGTTPATITLTANPSNLPRGRYLAQVAASAGVYGAYLNVYLTVGSGGGALTVSPSGLTFFGGSTGPAPQPQTLQITPRTGGDAAVQFRASASSSGGWLSVNPFPIRAPGSLTVVVLPTEMAPGTYSGTVTLTPLDGRDPTVVPVLLVISGFSNPIRLTQSALTFNHQTGGTAPPSQYIDITTPAAALQPFTAASSVPWLRVSSVLSPTPAATVSGLTPARIFATVDPGTLTTGTYTGTLTVSSVGFGNKEVPVSLVVGLAPTLNASPSSVVLDDVVGFETFVTITSTSSSITQFTAVVSPAVSWLTVVPTSGSTQFGAQSLTITGKPTGLPEGTYTTNVNLVFSGGSSVVIPVSLTSLGASGVAPTLVVPDQTIALTGISGLPNTTQAIDILTTGGARLPFSAAATSKEGWLRVEPFTGEAPVRLILTADSTAVQNAGDYEGSVTITSLATGDKYTIPVTFKLERPAMAVAPALLTFTQTQRRAAPPAQTLQITGNVPNTFTIRSATPWVKVDTLSGVTPATIKVSVDPTGLPPGANSAAIQILGPNNQISVPVTLTVLDPPGPVANLDSLTFSYELGSPVPPSRLLGVSSPDEPIDFTAAVATTSGGNWLAVTPRSGRTPANLVVSIDVSRVIPGQHTGTITLSTADKAAPTKVVNVKLTVNPATVVVQDILHAATFSPTPIAPGQLISIVGSGMGPLTGAGARPSAGGVMETRLGEIRVLFDGVPAPLLFVRTDQINAIVPYSIYGRATARVQVEWGTSLSLPIEAKVVDAAPGLFTTSPLGRGQAAALNVDMTPNSAANPAARGSIITLFGTGEGQSDPPGQDGRVIASDVRHPLLPVTATIGGQVVDITYIGSAPTLVSGIFQANLRIPEDIEPGNLPVQLTVGTANTQSAVTIAVR